MLDGHDDGSGKAIALSVVNIPFSGKEVAQGASNLSLNMAEAMLLLWGFDFAVNWPSRFRFLELTEELMSSRPLSQPFAQLASNFARPVVGRDYLRSDVTPEIVFA
jgi:hypothetical protein